MTIQAFTHCYGEGYGDASIGVGDFTLLQQLVKVIVMVVMVLFQGESVAVGDVIDGFFKLYSITL